MNDKLTAYIVVTNNQNSAKSDKETDYRIFLNILDNINYMLTNKVFNLEGHDKVVTDWIYDLTLQISDKKVRYIQRPINKDKGFQIVVDLICNGEQLEELLFLYKADPTSLDSYINRNYVCVESIFEYD